MPALAPYATRSDPKPTNSQESLRNSRQERCPCSSPPSRRRQRKEWANTPSSFISTTDTSWEYIRGSFCGIGVRVRSVRRRGLATQVLIHRKCIGPDFSGPNNSWVLTAPCDYLSIDRDNSPSSYFCREAVPAFAPHRTCAHNTERGPDGIRTRICYRRRVLCSRYTTGPQRIYSRFARIITVGSHNRTGLCFKRGTVAANPL
jgi:hypothetical protein